jgi:ankyrin repeat protein
MAAQDGATSSLFASQNGHIEVVQLLLDKGANLDAAMLVRRSLTHSDTPPLAYPY